MIDWFQARTTAMVTELQELVQIESPTRDKAAVDALGAVVAEQARALGATVTVERRSERGNHLVAHWNGSVTRRQILLLCHMDTVWPLGTLAERPIRIVDGRFYGPGSYDMKGGIVIALTAVRGLQALGAWPERPITILFTSDEELGSRTSRALIEDQARRSALVLVMEPALASGALKTSRKGTGWFVVTASGVAAHAGGSHAEGINAIEELAHQILTLQRMTNYERGTTVNVGRVLGGERTNVVPDQATLWVDLRVTGRDEGQRMLTRILSLEPRLPGASLHVRGKLSRPPMPRDDVVIETFRRAASIAAELAKR